MEVLSGYTRFWITSPCIYRRDEGDPANVYVGLPIAGTDFGADLRAHLYGSEGSAVVDRSSDERTCRI